MLLLLTVEAGTIKEGSGFLPSRQVLGHAITACTIQACIIKVVQVLEAVQRRINIASALDSHGSSCS
jgi:hypothetical protein